MYTIFLDIDGVLKPFRSNGSGLNWVQVERHFSAVCVAVLNDILNQLPLTEIIISSEWRLLYTLDELKHIFEINGINSDLIIGVTPIVGHCGLEISQDIKENNIEKFVILDDMSKNMFVCDSETDKLFERRYHKCDYATGITYSDKSIIIKKLTC
jgi:hypothetical protein